MSLSRPGCCPFCGGGGDGQERVCPHGQGDVAVPGVVAADLVVVEADLVLRGLETLLDRPPGAGDAGEFFVGGVGKCPSRGAPGEKCSSIQAGCPDSFLNLWMPPAGTCT
jgi:hypothetical protein